MPLGYNNREGFDLQNRSALTQVNLVVFHGLIPSPQKTIFYYLYVLSAHARPDIFSTDSAHSPLLHFLCNYLIIYAPTYPVEESAGVTS